LFDTANSEIYILYITILMHQYYINFVNAVIIEFWQL
jgi:hypothetical protein